MVRIAMVCPGRFGWALALLLARLYAVTVVVRDEGKAKRWQRERRCDKTVWLSKIEFPENLWVIPLQEFKSQEYDYCFLGSPVEYLVDNLNSITWHPGVVLIALQKGFLGDKCPIEVVQESVPQATVLSCTGACVSRDVARAHFGLLIAAPVGGEEAAMVFQRLWPPLKVCARVTQDFRGVARLDLLRTVLSLEQGLVVGFCESLDYSFSTAALILSGCIREYELAAKVLHVWSWAFTPTDRGGKIPLADTILCASDRSRNWQYGYLRGLGRSHKEALAEMEGEGVVEGVRNAQTLYELYFRRQGVPWRDNPQTMFLLHTAARFLKDGDRQRVVEVLTARLNAWCDH